jgi:hypothetical protein
MASTNPLTKVARQHETTWTQLHKRIADIPFQFEEIFPEDIATFLRHKAVSLNSSIGYLIPSLLTTTAFLSAKNGCTVQTLTHARATNKHVYYMDKGILLGTKTLVLIIRHYIRELSGVFSVCHA